jgi:hypothetical protein
VVVSLLIRCSDGARPDSCRYVLFFPGVVSSFPIVAVARQWSLPIHLVPCGSSLIAVFAVFCSSNALKMRRFRVLGDRISGGLTWALSDSGSRIGHL